VSDNTGGTRRVFALPTITENIPQSPLFSEHSNGDRIGLRFLRRPSRPAPRLGGAIGHRLIWIDSRQCKKNAGCRDHTDTKCRPRNHRRHLSLRANTRTTVYSSISVWSATSPANIASFVLMETERPPFGGLSNSDCHLS